MDGLALLQEAKVAGLSIAADGDRLIIRGPRSAEPIALRLLAHKAEVLALLGAGRPCPCGWLCFDPALALPCVVARGEMSLEEYARACRPEDPEGAEAIVKVYARAWSFWKDMKEAVEPKPRPSCPHQSAKEVEDRWGWAGDADVAACACCGGPTANIRQLRCQRCPQERRQVP